MAKRFTDTDKWKRPWFRKLESRAQLFWIYLCDTCDHAGVWIADFDLASYQVGFDVNESTLTRWFGNKLIKVDADKFCIPSFFEFQYRDTKPNYSARVSALKILARYGLANDSGLSLPDCTQTGGSVGGLSMESPIIGISMGIGISNSVLGEKISKIPDEIKQEWEATLAHYNRNPNWIRDESPLLRAYLRVKDWTRVRNALIGFRKEEKNDKYDPAKHCNLTRLHSDDKFQRLEALGESSDSGGKVDFAAMLGEGA